MGQGSLRGLGWAFALVLAALLLGNALLASPSSIGPQDEFGRNALGSAIASLAYSLANASWMSVVVLFPPIVVGYLAAVSKAQFLNVVIAAVIRTIDVIPLFLWVAIAWVSMGSLGGGAGLCALAIVAFPFVLGLILPPFKVIASEAFAQNAAAARSPVVHRIARVFLPNAWPALTYPFAVVFGLSLTFDAVLGVLGMVSRDQMSLGTLILRVKERGAVDTFLVYGLMIDLLICLIIFWAARRSIRTESQLDSA